jgi:pimeloyl-ACP methyl ester carboxylesterase
MMNTNKGTYIRRLTFLLSLLFLISVALGQQKISSKQKAIEPAGINLENIQYPFPVKFINTPLQWQQLRMAYMDVQPDKPNGKNIMLMHGKNFNGAYWETTANELKKRGYRVIIPDQLGFGKSSKPRQFQYSFQLLSILTKAVLDTLKIDKVIVLGHSMGGMLATRFALMYPNLVEKLILEDPIGLEDYNLKVPYQPVEYWYWNELRQDYNSLKKYQQDNYYHGTWKNEYEKWMIVQVRSTMNVDYSILAWNSALMYDMIMTQPVVYELAQLQAPTLLIIGELDKTAPGKNLVSEEVRKTMGNYPELGKQTAEKIRNAKLVLIPKTGHIPHVESFNEFMKALNSFLDIPIPE